MSNFKERLDALSPARLRGVRRGIEKESLRAQPDGKLALTPHPAALGSALTHPHITNLREAAATCRVDGRASSFEIAGIDVDQRDDSSFLGKRERGTFGDSSAGASDDRNLP